MIFTVQLCDSWLTELHADRYDTSYVLYPETRDAIERVTGKRPALHFGRAAHNESHGRDRLIQVVRGLRRVVANTI